MKARKRYTLRTTVNLNNSSSETAIGLYRSVPPQKAQTLLSDPIWHQPCQRISLLPQFWCSPRQSPGYWVTHFGNKPGDSGCSQTTSLSSWRRRFYYIYQ